MAQDQSDEEKEALQLLWADAEKNIRHYCEHMNRLLLEDRLRRR